MSCGSARRPCTSVVSRNWQTNHAGHSQLVAAGVEVTHADAGYGSTRPGRTAVLIADPTIRAVSQIVSKMMRKLRSRCLSITSKISIDIRSVSDRRFAAWSDTFCLGEMRKTRARKRAGSCPQAPCKNESCPNSGNPFASNSRQSFV